MIGSRKQKKKFYQTIKVPKPVLDEIVFTEMKVAMDRKKLPKLRDIVSPEKCPVCGGELKRLEVEAKVEYVECKRCGFKQPKISIEASGSDLYEFLKALGIGVLVGLGLAALVYLLTHSSEG